MAARFRATGAATLLLCMISAAASTSSIPVSDDAWDAAVGTRPHVGALRVDYMSDARDLVGIASRQPRFCWQWTAATSAAPRSRLAHQSAYQIVVSESLSKVVVWDSGKVSSDLMTHVLYAGDQLKSSTTYNWKLRVYDLADVASDWATSSFHTALLNPSQEFGGMWIGSNGTAMNQFRKEFRIVGIVASATVSVSGIGYYELLINGQKVDPTRVLDPGYTEYEKRVLFATYDVSSRIQSEAGNCLGVNLGNGWYSQDMNGSPSVSRPLYGPPRLRLQLDVLLTDGSSLQILSDDSWAGRQGPIVGDSVYNGESYDARLELDNWAQAGFVDPQRAWAGAAPMSAPGGTLSPQTMEPIRVIETLAPVSVYSITLNTWIIDLGQDIAGWVRLRLQGNRGLQVRIRYAEILEHPEASTIYDPAAIYIDNLRSATQEDVYTLKGGSATGEYYEPRFTVHGFRFVEVFGATNDLTQPGAVVGMHVRSSVSQVGTMTFPSSTLLQQVQDNIARTQSNLMMSLPTDCHQRDERKGWMGDSALTVDEMFFNFWAPSFMSNFLNLIQDEQGADGSVTDTVPHSFGNRPADPSWGTAYTVILWTHYLHYGDIGLLHSHYAGVKAWVQFVANQWTSSGCTNLYYWFGDWVPPPPAQMVSGHVTSCTSFLNDLQLIINMATVLRNPVDVSNFTSLRVSVAEDFHRSFFDTKTGGYADNGQTANAFALSQGVVPANLRSSVFANLVADIAAAKNHFTTGILGLRYLLPVLSTFNRTDIAVSLMSQTTYPSFGYSINNAYENATSLWEIWNAPFEAGGMNSRSHIMFGSPGAWFYRTLAGINPNGMDEMEVAPHVAFNLPSVAAEYNSIKGPIRVEWSHSTDAVLNATQRLEVTLDFPRNTRLRFVPPFMLGRSLISLADSVSGVLWERDIAGSANAGADFELLGERDADAASVSLSALRLLSPGRFQLSLLYALERPDELAAAMQHHVDASTTDGSDMFAQHFEKMRQGKTSRHGTAALEKIKYAQH